MLLLIRNSIISYHVSNVAYVTNGAAAIVNMIVFYDHDDAFLARNVFISAKKEIVNMRRGFYNK